jgi:hypothetical protein
MYPSLSITRMVTYHASEVANMSADMETDASITEATDGIATQVRTFSQCSNSLTIKFQTFANLLEEWRLREQSTILLSRKTDTLRRNSKPKRPRVRKDNYSQYSSVSGI